MSSRLALQTFLGLLVAGAVLFSASCGPNPPPPLKVMALVPNQAGAFSTTLVELKTLTQFTALKGSVAEFMGGNRVVLDSTDPLQNLNGGLLNMTDEQRYEVLVKDKGSDVRGNFIEQAGVFWPSDFHTWNMVSAYYNFEKTYEYFAQVYDGQAPTELQKLRVMYWADVHVESSEPMVDNASYFSFIKSFVIAPFKKEPLVPLPMNIGVIGHEVAHRAFNYRVLKNAGIHPALGSWNGQPFNLLKSLDEGLADFHGFGVTCREAAGCRPSYLAVSLSDKAAVESRNVSRTNACMDADLRNAFNNFSPGQWVSSDNMYRVGTVFAAALYQAGNRASGPSGVTQLQKNVIASYGDLSKLLNDNLVTPGAFTLEAVTNAIAKHVSDPELKKFLCSEFSTRLQLECGTFPCDKMPDCSPLSHRESSCPLLPTP